LPPTTVVAKGEAKGEAVAAVYIAKGKGKAKAAAAADVAKAKPKAKAAAAAADIAKAKPKAKAAAAAGALGLQLGCSKCRWRPSGCSQRKKASYTGFRWSL
jgi:hypothetical protein